MVVNTKLSRRVFFLISSQKQNKTKQQYQQDLSWTGEKKITQTNFRLNYSALTNQKKKTKNSTIKIARNNPKFLWISACMCVFMFTLRIFFFFWFCFQHGKSTEKNEGHLFPKLSLFIWFYFKLSTSTGE